MQKERDILRLQQQIITGNAIQMLRMWTDKKFKRKKRKKRLRPVKEKIMQTVSP
jgi:hypothetical protein